MLIMQQRYHLSTHELTVCTAAKIDLKRYNFFDLLNVLDVADLTTIQFKTDGLVTDINSPIVRKRVFRISVNASMYIEISPLPNLLNHQE